MRNIFFPHYLSGEPGLLHEGVSKLKGLTRSKLDFD